MLEFVFKVSSGKRVAFNCSQPSSTSSTISTQTQNQRSILELTQQPSTSTSNSSLPAIPTRIPGPIGRQGRTHMIGFSFCPKTNCRFCTLLNKLGQIKSTTTGVIYTFMRKVSCRSSNLIYKITCKACNIQYVGQTLLCL